MSITDELRKVAAKTECANGRCEKLYRGDLERIADRIDAEHESACAEAYGNGVMSVPIALDESAWVKLPKDADGVPIHVGDEMEWADGMTFEVVGIGDGTLFYVESDDADHAEWTGASTKRHHHAPTAEDYKRGYDMGFASADDWLAQHEDAMAEHGWVRKNKEHVISHATVEVTPHIDWARMADELDEFVEIVRGMALADGEDA